MPIASKNIQAINPSFNNQPAALTASTVVPRADGIGNSTDPWIVDLGTDCAYAVAAMTTVITGSPASLTLQLQGSIDGTVWTTIATSTSTSGDTQFTASNNSVQFGQLRVNCSAVSGGTNPKVQLAVSAYTAPQTNSLQGTQNVTGTVTANQGSAAAVASGWPVKITDGTNTASVNAAFGGGVGALRTQLINSTGGLQEISGGLGVAVGPAPQSAANILSGSATAANTAGAQTIITIPATRTWVGTVNVCMTNQAATGSLVTASVATAGTGVTPAAGTVVAVQAGSVGTVAGDATNTALSGQLYVTAPGGNSVTLTLTNSTATTCTSTAQANGVLL